MPTSGTHGVYFGRDDEIARITERLNAWRTLGGEPLRVLLGQSGSGKSSFLRAGLIPRLKREKHNWIVLPPFRPHLNPLDAFARSLACVSPAAEDWRTWRSRLVDENGPKFISDFADDLRLAAKGAEAGILILIDQGEELFAVSKPEEAQHFLRLISNILVESDAYIAVMTLRSDYLGHLQQALTIRFEEVSLKPLPLERIPEIIEGPAKVAGLQVEAALLLQTTKDANTEDALPLLAFTLRELYEQYARSSKQLTLKDYHHLGGVPGANPLESVVRQAADRILGEASPFERELDALHGAFLAMVRIKDGEYVRSPVEWERLNPLARPLLERFVKARLLVIGEREGKNVVEVAHESLLRSWPVLRKWLDAAGEFLIGRRQLDDALAAYQAADDAKKKSALLTALLLDRAHSWLSTYPDLLTHEERLFIAESRAQKDELLQADQARIRELCLWQTRAVARTVEDLLREGQLFQALLLATEPLTSQALAAGMHLAYPTDAEAERVRIEVCRSIQQLKFTDEFGTMCQRVVVSPRRQHVLVITDDHELFLHAAGTATPFRLPQDKRLAAIDAGFNTTETRLIILFSEGQITVCDVPSGAVVSELCIQDGALSSIEIDPSGNYAIVRTDDYQHHIVNLAEQKILGSTQAAPAVVRTGRVKPIWDQSLRLMRREKMSAALPLLGTSTLNGAKPDNLLSAEFSQNGEWLITIASSKVGIWATDPVEERLVLPRFAGPVIFSPDSRTLAVAAWNAKLKLYSLPGCEETHVLAGHTGEVLGAAFAPRSEWLATYSRDKTVRVWTLQTGRERHRLMHHSIPTAIAINADGSRIASVVEDGELYIWDADTGSLIRRVTTLALEKKSYRVRSAEFANQGKGLLLALDACHLMAYLPLSVHEQKEHLIYNPNRHYDACIAAARISPDGEYLAVGYDDGNVCLWKTPFDWVSLHKVWSHATRAADLGVTDIAFTSDSQRVISIGFDGVAMVWDTGSGDKVSEWRDDRAGALAVEAKLAVSNDDNIAVNTATYPEPDSLGLVFWYVESGMEVERAPIRAEPRKVTVNPTRGQVLTVGPAAVLWQTPLVDSGALLQACRAVLPRAMLDSERKRYGLSGESYSWQRELWPYTDPVTLWKERMLLSFGSLYAVVISTLRSRLARLTAMGIQGTSDQLYVYASAILDSYQRELSAGLDDLYPFSHDLAKLLDLLGYCWDETMNFVMQAGDIDGARRILSEYKGPSGTTYDQVVKQLNVRQSAQ